MKVLAVETDSSGRLPVLYVVQIDYQEMVVLTGAERQSQLPSRSGEFDICESYREGQRINDAATRSNVIRYDLTSETGKNYD